MFGEEGLDPGGVGDFVPGEVKTGVRDAVTVENLHHAFGISAVHENEDAVLCARTLERTDSTPKVPEPCMRTTV
mgnify:CR=1 FL=1